MFHLEFQQNQTNSNPEIHESNVENVRKTCESKTDAQRKSERECDQMPENEPTISTENTLIK